MEAIIKFLNKLAVNGVRLATEDGQLNCYAQKGRLTADIRDGIVRYKSEIIALLQSDGKHPLAHTDGSPL